jgi:two-component SAPR family response regulator
MAKHILVVDDDQQGADTTVMAIQKLSQGAFTAEAVYGGKQCLERLSRDPQVDLILLDLNMPEVNGADVIRTLLSQQPFPRLKILPTTAWGPGWAKHWKLSDLQGNASFQKLVTTETCDKTTDFSDMMTQIKKVLA